MKAHELAAITQQNIDKRNNERPKQILADLAPKMKSEAQDGRNFIDFVFTDHPEVVDRVLASLQKDGFVISSLERGVTKISWDKPAFTQCIFDIAWAGQRCNNLAEQGSFCQKHSESKCYNCHKQATRECDFAGQFVCGTLLCFTCHHHK
jgi:hypothetical protein